MSSLPSGKDIACAYIDDEFIGVSKLMYLGSLMFTEEVVSDGLNCNNGKIILFKEKDRLF